MNDDVCLVGWLAFWRLVGIVSIITTMVSTVIIATMTIAVMFTLVHYSVDLFVHWFDFLVNLSVWLDNFVQFLDHWFGDVVDQFVWLVI